jgi:signal transduction histidine kinase
LKKDILSDPPAGAADVAMATPDLALHLGPASASATAASFCIAAIGSSAGGIEAICEFFEAMPADSGIAFVVIQHLYPGQKSLAAEIIGKHTTISAKPAEEGMRVEPDHIYTIPPNTYPSLVDGRLHLDEPQNKAGPRLPIDHFFASLGKDQRQRAIGIVLSGSGSDGSLGLKWIEANGGIVLAQSPDSAQFDSMPRSAIGTGLVHKVLAVADMPVALTNYARQSCATGAMQADHCDLQLPMPRSGKPLVALERPALPVEQALSLSPTQLARITQQLLLAKFSPAAVLVNTRLEILYFCGPIENYLQMPPGFPSQDLLAQSRDGLRSRLRNALRQAISSGDMVVVDDARVRRNKGFHPVRLSVVPAQHAGMLYLVVFEDIAAPAAIGADAVGSDSALVRQLEDDLRATRDDLQNSVERLESMNEALNVSHEEVVSINQELQSINDELENSKAELQSLNGELTTVNLQLQMKVADLEMSNADITNLLASSQIATVCLDCENHIRWFSPSMKMVSNMIVGDIGRPITDFSSGGLGGNLVEDAASVLETLVPVQRELMSPDGLCYLRRIVPYRSDNDHIGGVVITYTDITEAQRASQAAVAAQRAMAASLEDRVRERTAQLRMLTSELALTEERERRVLARDLHDDLGQVLAIVKIKLTSLEESERRGALKGPLQEIETLIDQANRSARSLMLQLSPPTLQTLGLVPALEWLGEEMERIYGLAVLIDKEGDLPMLEEPARTTIFRAVRELLINVSKHAGTNVAQINCHQSADGQLSISVTDQGLGFDYQQAMSSPAKDSGFGLISVRERIEFIGGETTVDTMPGYGTTITIVFPAGKNV